MDPRTLRRKRVLVPAAVAVVALGVGGTAWAATASADQVGGSERDRVSAAALRAVGDGRVTDVETSDDRGEAYEVEVVRADGTEVDLALDDDLGVVTREDDRPDGTDRDDQDDAAGSGDRVLSATERDRAGAAAEEAVGAGSVAVDVDADDERGTAYDVEVRAADGTEWDVDLDRSFEVVSERADR